MALVDPTIALGFRQPEQPNLLGQYAQIAQLQSGQQAQQLNALKMQEAQAAMQERNALRQLDPSSPDYGKQLMRVSPTQGLAYQKNVSDAATAEATRGKTQVETAAAKQKLMSQGLRDISTRPSDAQITAYLEDVTDSPLFSPAEKQKAQQNATMLLGMPFEERKAYLASQGATAAELQPKLSVGPTGIVQTPAYGGPATVVAGTGAAFQMTPAQIAQNKTAQDRLTFDQNKFNWEKANPGMELKEDENGNLFGINKRTLQVTPVIVGGGAASAGGVATDAGKPFKGKDSSKTAVSEQQAAYNIGRVLTAANQIKDIGSKDPSSAQPGAAEALAASVGMTGTANLARNANRQIVQGAQRDALDALLYLATGAAYNKEQLQGQMDAYIPAFTDTTEAVAAKKTRMTALIKSAKTRAGKAWTPEMDTAMDALTSPPAPAAAAGAGRPAPAANVIVNPQFPGFSIGKP